MEFAPYWNEIHGTFTCFARSPYDSLTCEKANENAAVNTAPPAGPVDT